MPIKKSAKKALRQAKKKRAHNLFYKNKIKNLTKEIKILLSQKKIEEAKKLLSLLYKVLDKAVKEKVIKKNTANRKKSRLTKIVNKFSKDLNLGN